MAIKLYKSQLEPTSKTSNVYDRRQISLSEASSIGNAMKGMLKSGENFYIKHQQIKSENEVLEKEKICDELAIISLRDFLLINLLLIT